jgi:AraC-like DNA-binding protein
MSLRHQTSAFLMTNLRRQHAEAGEPLHPVPAPDLWTLILEGTALLESPQGTVTLRAGDAALASVPDGCSVIAVDPLQAIVSDLRPLLLPFRMPNPFIATSFSRRHPAATRLVASCPLEDRHQPTLWTVSYAGLLGAAMVASWQESALGDPPVRDSAIADLLKAIADAPGERWTLPKMAKAVHLSPSAVSARFRRATGRTPAEVLRELRMSEARRMLSETCKSIGTVAFEVGYGSTAAFSRAFSAQHGVAPNGWRRDSITACGR